MSIETHISLPDEVQMWMDQSSNPTVGDFVPSEESLHMSFLHRFSSKNMTILDRAIGRYYRAMTGEDLRFRKGYDAFIFPAGSFFYMYHGQDDYIDNRQKQRGLFRIFEDDPNKDAVIEASLAGCQVIWPEEVHINASIYSDLHRDNKQYASVGYRSLQDFVVEKRTGLYLPVADTPRAIQQVEAMISDLFRGE